VFQRVDKRLGRVLVLFRRHRLFLLIFLTRCGGDGGWIVVLHGAFSSPFREDLGTSVSKRGKKGVPTNAMHVATYSVR
jgi:hypothetical protein